MGILGIGTAAISKIQCLKDMSASLEN